MQLRSLFARVAVALVVFAVSGLVAPQITRAQSGSVGILACSTVSSVSVRQQVWVNVLTSYHASGRLTTTGCNSNYTIKASTSSFPDGTGECAKLRVRLFPSSGGEIVPRSPVYVCPGAGYIELANYIIAGTSYRVESTNGPITVSVQH